MMTSPPSLRNRNGSSREALHLQPKSSIIDHPSKNHLYLVNHMLGQSSLPSPENWKYWNWWRRWFLANRQRGYWPGFRMEERQTFVNIAFRPKSLPHFCDDEGFWFVSLLTGLMLFLHWICICVSGLDILPNVHYPAIITLCEPALICLVRYPIWTIQRFEL